VGKAASEHEPFDCLENVAEWNTKWSPEKSLVLQWTWMKLWGVVGWCARQFRKEILPLIVGIFWAVSRCEDCFLNFLAKRVVKPFWESPASISVLGVGMCGS